MLHFGDNMSALRRRSSFNRLARSGVATVLIGPHDLSSNNKLALCPLHPRLPDRQLHRRTAVLQAHGKAFGARASVDSARESSEAFISNLTSRTSKKRNAVADAAVWAATMKDVKNKFMDMPVDRRFFDELFGLGGWLPLPRFPIKQGDNWRPIDDAKASGTNSAAHHERRVHTTSLDFIAQFCIWLRCVWVHIFAESHPYCTIEGGVDDETSAFRFVPTCEQDSPFLTIAVFNPVLKRIQFGMMWGPPLGVGSAVTNYNRRPELIVHTMLMYLAVLMVHFIRSSCDAGDRSPQDCPLLRLRCLPVRLDEDCPFSRLCNWHFRTTPAPPEWILE
jgi:hypothetical protein